jgi:hypothetical protein
MHQRSGLQGVPRAAAGFLRHAAACKPPKFFIDEWEQFSRGVVVALARQLEQLRDLMVMSIRRVGHGEGSRVESARFRNPVYMIRSC